LGVCPAFILDHCFIVLARNRAASLIFGDFFKIGECWLQDLVVQGIVEGNTEFNHPRFGNLKLDHITFKVPGIQKYTLRVFTPLAGTDNKLKHLLDTYRKISRG